MSLAGYIKNVRERSEPEKQRLAFIWTLTLTVLIAFVWLISFSLNLSNNAVEEARLKAEAAKLAQTQVATSAPRQNFWSRSGDFLTDGLDSINSGFWTIAGWLHK